MLSRDVEYAHCRVASSHTPKFEREVELSSLMRSLFMASFTTRRNSLYTSRSIVHFLALGGILWVGGQLKASEPALEPRQNDLHSLALVHLRIRHTKSAQNAKLVCT